MAKQTVTTTTVSRTYVANKSSSTVTRSSPKNTSIGSKSSKGSARCPSCGRYMSRAKH